MEAFNGRLCGDDTCQKSTTAAEYVYSIRLNGFGHRRQAPVDVAAAAAARWLMLMARNAEYRRRWLSLADGRRPAVHCHSHAYCYPSQLTYLTQASQITTSCYVAKERISASLSAHWLHTHRWVSVHFPRAHICRPRIANQCWEVRYGR